MLLVCSLFFGLMLCGYSRVIFGLIITFWVNCLHGFLSLFRLFVLYVTAAALAFTFV